MLVQLHLDPNDKQLRQFGLVAIAALGVVGGLVWWKNGLFGLDFGDHARTVSYALWATGALSALFSWVAPRANRPLFIGLSLLAFPIGWVVSHLALAFLFFGVLTPLALLFRLLGRDALARRWDPDADTYWTDLPSDPEPKDYFRQF